MKLSSLFYRHRISLVIAGHTRPTKLTVLFRPVITFVRITLIYHDNDNINENYVMKIKVFLTNNKNI